MIIMHSFYKKFKNSCFFFYFFYYQKVSNHHVLFQFFLQGNLFQLFLDYVEVESWCLKLLENCVFLTSLVGCQIKSVSLSFVWRGKPILFLDHLGVENSKLKIVLVCPSTQKIGMLENFILKKSQHMNKMDMKFMIRFSQCRHKLRLNFQKNTPCPHKKWKTPDWKFQFEAGHSLTWNCCIFGQNPRLRDKQPS